MADDQGMAEILKQMRGGENFKKLVNQSQSLNAGMIRDKQILESTEQNKKVKEIEKTGGLKCPNCKKYNVSLTTAIIDERPIHYGFCLDCKFGSHRTWVIKKLK